MGVRVSEECLIRALPPLAPTLQRLDLTYCDGCVTESKGGGTFHDYFAESGVLIVSDDLCVCGQ
jgi:hypothetical protein